MKDFCCQICGSGSYDEIYLDRAYFGKNTATGKGVMVNCVYICDGCSTPFFDLEKFSLTVKQQKERKRILAEMSDIVSRSIGKERLTAEKIEEAVRGDFYKERHDVHKKDG